MKTLTLALSLLFSSICAFAQESPATMTVISGRYIAGDYNVHANTVFQNSTVLGVLRVDASNVVIQNNKLRGIWIPGSNPTNNVRITGNEITGAANDCVDVNDGPVSPIGLVIENNHIHNCGTAWPGNPHFHAVYVQVPGVTVRYNTIWNVNSPISMRSSGIVEYNNISQIPCAGGIEYFSDHDAAPDQPLIIRNNVIISTLHNCSTGGNFWHSYRGLLVFGNGIGTNKLAVHTFIVTQNYLRVLNTTSDPSGVYLPVYTAIREPGMTLYHNWLINEIPTGGFIGPNAVGSEDDYKSHQ